MSLKQSLEETALHLEKLEAAARKLQNQNFADIVQAARRRTVQLTQHPDVDAVERVLVEGERPQDPAAPFPQNGPFPAQSVADEEKREDEQIAARVYP